MPLPLRRMRPAVGALLLPVLAGCAGAAAPVAGPQPAESPVAAVDTIVQPKEPLYAWVQLGPQDSWMARAVFDSTVTACPDGASARSRPDSLFPVLVCEAVVARDVTHAYFFGLRFERPLDDPRAVAVMGDTGCRLRGRSVQNCADPAAWPFAAVADSVLRGRPELLVHLGDYHYRESCDTACPAGPVGYGWAAWEADFFRPAARLLPAAPWVFVRGNHESCGRAGEGWFRFFDPGERPDTAAFCSDYTHPYSVRFAWGDLLIHDSACAPSPVQCAPADSAIAIYTRQFDQLRELARDSRAAWLLSHTPLWAAGSGSFPDSAGAWVLQRALAASGDGRLPVQVAMHLAGHLHQFQGLGFAGGRPPALVIGNGGTLLDPEFPAPAPGRQIDGATVNAYASLSAFGWSTVEPDSGAWRVRLRRLDGRPAPVCRVAGQTLSCATP